VFEERARLLARAIERLRPDVLLIDHYPFSKWELEAEILRAIEVARAGNRAVRVLCSLRDIAPQGRYEAVDAGAYAARVLAVLEARFDAILVHADPAFTRIEEHFPRARDLPIPLRYTGFVVDHPSPALAERPREPYAVLSCGGGARGLPALLASMDAFGRLSAEGGLGPMHLVVFAPAFASSSDMAALQAAACRGPFTVRPFAEDFDRWLSGAALSVSRAGYNTCAGLLRAKARAVLLPDPVMADQVYRARRWADLGLAAVASGESPDVGAIVAAARRALAGPPPHHSFDLDGVAHTQALIERLAGWTRQARL
jgi:predicted glycosyltransferase